MGSQDDVVFDIEGVLHVPRRMVLGDVQRLEIIIIQLDFRPFHHRKAKTGKDSADLFPDLRDRMETAVPDGPPGKRDVHPLAEGDLLLPGGCQSLENLIDSGGKGLLDLVAVFAELGPVPGRHTRDVAEQSGQQALPTEITGTDGLEFLFRSGLPELGLRLFPKDLKLSRHACRSPFAMVAISENPRGS